MGNGGKSCRKKIENCKKATAAFESGRLSGLRGQSQCCHVFIAAKDCELLVGGLNSFPATQMKTKRKTPGKIRAY